MTESLDCHFEAALTKRSSWDASRLRIVLSECKERVPESQIDWEEGDENWGRLVQNGEVILLVNALIPLAFVLLGYRDSVQDVLGDCAAVPVESFSNDAFSVNSKLLEQVVGRKVSANVKYEQLSIDDLWWATV